MPAIGFRAVIFDMDGLVLDSETTYFRAWRRAAGAMGYQISDHFCGRISGAHGDAVGERILEHFGADFDVSEFHRISSRYWLEDVSQHGIIVKAGFFSLLAVIRQLHLPFCLATNSRRHNTEQCLAWAGLSDVFPLIVAGDDVQHGKPAPDMFQKAARELGVSNKDCLVLEDSPVGIAAAVAAGSPCIFVPSRLPADAGAAEVADEVCNDLHGVADFISAAFQHPL